MNQLELVRRARPDVPPLDPETRARIAQEVFGDDLPSLPAPVWRHRLLAATAVAVVVVGLGVIARRSPASTPARPTAPATAATISTTAATTPATAPRETTSTIPDPTTRFEPSADYEAKQHAAVNAFIARCMTAAGFEYRGSPYQTDTELADDAASIKAGTYEAAYFGVGGSGGGCVDQAYANIFGTQRADVQGDNLRGQMWGTWTRTALSDPALRTQLDDLVACARQHGVSIDEVPARPDRAVDAVLKGLGLIAGNDPRLTSPSGYTPKDAVNTVYDEICPTYSQFAASLETATAQAEANWIEANPQRMATLDAEYADDISRFNYIIDHNGELPPPK